MGSRRAVGATSSWAVVASTPSPRPRRWSSAARPGSRPGSGPWVAAAGPGGGGRVVGGGGGAKMARASAGGGERGAGARPLLICTRHEAFRLTGQTRVIDQLEALSFAGRVRTVVITDGPGGIHALR